MNLTSSANGTVCHRKANEAESILRAEFAFSAFDCQRLWSIEGAENYVDIESRLESFEENEPSLVVDFDGDSARVEEKRAESGLNE